MTDRRDDHLNSETCKRCQGNGEIVTDWDRYKRPHEGDIGDEAVAECPDCGGEGIIDNAGGDHVTGVENSHQISAGELVSNSSAFLLEDVGGGA
ncbi:hypothetical protein G6L13_05480 [Agrobacterium tumefaciens]|uniref:hypothetical protein n=1 Tax=Agrobacterium tumefaciens TaxID=358 RepID=UPI001571A505|nr:hypothetical protein [Agrobacterium tumefaciens]NTA79935.1 hypothetical protein [Agrobacterium tumefaciens]